MYSTSNVHRGDRKEAVYIVYFPDCERISLLILLFIYCFFSALIQYLFICITFYLSKTNLKKHNQNIGNFSNWLPKKYYAVHFSFLKNEVKAIKTFLESTTLAVYKLFQRSKAYKKQMKKIWMFLFINLLVDLLEGFYNTKWFEHLYRNIPECIC